MRAFFSQGVIGASTGPNPPFSGYVLKFNDDFTSFNGNDTGTNGWMTSYANGNRTNAGNSELEYYGDATNGPVNPFSIQSGTNLQIQATKASVTGTNPLGLPYNSGIINSSNSFYAKYGYYEMRAQLPAGQGMWPAFWSMEEVFGGATIWPPEIDVMEMLGNSPTTIYTTVHYVSGGNQQTGQANTTADSSTGFHTYGCDWKASTITWYFDGGQIFQVSTPPGLNVQMYLIANLAAGGTFPGNPDGTTPFPSNMLIDFIRFWANSDTTGVGGTLAIP